MSDTQRDRPEALADGSDIDAADPVNPGHPLNAGRVAWWLCLPGRDGPQWADLMGANHGAMAGLTGASGWRPTTRPGGFGHLQLGDYQGSVLGPRTLNYSVATLATWVCLPVLPGSGAWIFGFSNGGGFDKYFSIDPSGVVSFTVYNNGTFTATAATPIAAGAWHRLMGVSDGTNLTLYLDGRQDAQVACTGSYAGYGGPNMLAGGPGGGLGSIYVNELIDDVCVWSRGLSAGAAALDCDLSRQGYPGVLNRT